jgi:hypothetical protein
LSAAASACTTQVSPGPQDTPSPSAAAPSPTGAATGNPPPSPIGSPGPAPCEPASLALRVTGWSGAAGHRIATVELQNVGSGACLVHALARPQLVDAAGVILIDGEPPGGSSTLEVAPGGVLATMVQDSNYCGPDPAQPVTVAFVLPEGLGRVLADAAPGNGLGGVPPCLGPAGSAGTIEMQPWQP